MITQHMFNEFIFIKALTERPETARNLCRVFQPEWLERAELRKILDTIINFTREKDTPPSVRTIRDILQNEDEARYLNRFKDILDHIEALPEDKSQFIYHTDKAKDVAITRSLKRLVNGEFFRSLQDSLEGRAQIGELKEWIQSFEESGEIIELNLKEAIEQMLVEEHESSNKIRTGIEFIDEWCGGGLRKKQMALVIAPSGEGKSICLGIIAHNISAQLEYNVLYITNELTMSEVAERFLSKITGTSLSAIAADPVTGYHGLERHWRSGLHNHLRIIEVMREVDTDFIESRISRYINIDGWKPDVVIIDYMERMKPTVSAERGKTWTWLGYIAKDLVRMAKRGNYLVWTAGQTNRAGYDSKAEQSVTHTQGSIQHIQEAAFACNMRKVKYPNADENTDILQFKPIKVRHYKGSHEPIYVEARLGHMKITNKKKEAFIGCETNSGPSAGEPQQWPGKDP